MTSFLYDHPGGEDFLLQYAGQDITQVLQSEVHYHSDTAYELLKDYYIGVLDAKNVTTKEPAFVENAHQPTQMSKRSSKFIDIEKPMLEQILKGNFDKDFYVEQVHIPRHAKKSPPIFKNPLLDSLTRCYWFVIPLFWSPVILYCFLRSLSFISLYTAFACIILGLFNWSIIEYTLHRFLFHVDKYLPNHKIFMALHFLTHGVHHFVPMDKYVLALF